MTIFIVIALAVFGAMCGSFAGAQTWRLRARQLAFDKAAGEKVNAGELKRLAPLSKTNWRSDRSIDLDTGQPLRWFELLPIASWLVQGGKSRHSGKPIGYFELVIEIGLALFFVLSYLLWPYELNGAFEVARLVIWLLAGVLLAIQFATDYKWKILWSGLSFMLIGLGAGFAALTVLLSVDSAAAIWSAVWSLLILGGLYFVLYAVSRERWVGLGDVFLGAGLGLLLADWVLALVALFLANLIGSVVVLVGFATKKIARKQQIPFGPFLILGAVLAQLVGASISQWYIGLF